MTFLSFVVWDFNPELINLFGNSIRWYGLFFALGFLLSQQIMFYIFRKDGKPEKDVETLTVYMILATIIGARLGHVLFYEPDKYLLDPIKILYIREGGLASHGGAIGILIALYLYVNYTVDVKYLKLIPGFISIPYWSKWKRKKREGQSYLWLVDRLVIVTCLVGALIRLGNFFNSEIEGIPTHSRYGVVFARPAEEIILAVNEEVTNVEFSKGDGEINNLGAPLEAKLFFSNPSVTEDQIKNIMETRVRSVFTRYPYVRSHINQPVDEPLDYSIKKLRSGYEVTLKTHGIVRHPAQLYESISTLLLGIILFILWYHSRKKNPEGLLFGIFLVVLWSLRFAYEFLKENQVDFEDSLTLNMGQILSIPFILIGFAVLIYAHRRFYSKVNE